MEGLKRGTVELLPHQDEWDREAERSIRELRQILGHTAIDLRHIGSTAIPSIHAKPIIDLVVGVEDLADVMPYAEPLRARGYIFRGSDAPNQLLVVKGDFERDRRTHHIHIVEWGGREWRNYLDFRDYLRASPERARAYDELKQQLAHRYPEDRKRYTAGKRHLVETLLEEARRWRNKEEEATGGTI